jgi:hypothetical protein
MAEQMLRPGLPEGPGPKGQQRLTKWLRVPAPKPATEADTVAAAASKRAASIAADIDCIAKRRKLGRKTTGNSRPKAVNPLAALEAVARLPDTSSALRRPPTYANGSGTW